MSSRLWLAVAFVLAFGATPARAETSLIAVILDQARIARLPAGTATLIVGNPMIADVTTLKDNNTMIITGKGFGQTNLIAIDATGSLIEEEQIQVVPARTVLVLQNGSSRISYACNPACMPTVQLGDDLPGGAAGGATHTIRRRSIPGRRARTTADADVLADEAARLPVRRDRSRGAPASATGERPSQPASAFSPDGPQLRLHRRVGLRGRCTGYESARVDSLTLVQGALSLWSYCSRIPVLPERRGYFHRLVSERLVRGPVVATMSIHDRAVGSFYSARRRGRASGGVRAR